MFPQNKSTYLNHRLWFLQRFWTPFVQRINKEDGLYWSRLKTKTFFLFCIQPATTTTVKHEDAWWIWQRPSSFLVSQLLTTLHWLPVIYVLSGYALTNLLVTRIPACCLRIPAWKIRSIQPMLVSSGREHDLPEPVCFYSLPQVTILSSSWKLKISCNS